jgi:hypothetical protein
MLKVCVQGVCSGCVSRVCGRECMVVLWCLYRWETSDTDALLQGSFAPILGLFYFYIRSLLYVKM